MAKAPRKKSAIENVLDRVYTGAALPFADIFAAAEAGGGDVIAGARVKRKAGVDQGLGSGIEMVPTALYNIANAMGANLKSPYLDAASKRVENAEAALRRGTNTPAPTNPLDLALELGGGVLVPGPKGGSAVKAVTKGITPAKVAAGAAKAASEVVLPFRQGGKIVTAVPVVAGVGVGLTEGIDAIANVEEYSGVADQVKKVSAPKPLDAEDQLLATIPGTEEELLASVPDDEDLVVNAGQINDMSTVPEPERGLSLMDQALLGGAAFGALALGMSAPSVIRALTKQRTSLQGGDLVGTKVNPQVTGPVTNSVAGIVQSDQAVRRALDVDAPVVAKPIRARLDLLAPASINQRTNYTLNTGQFPGSKVDIGPIGPQLNALATSLDADDMAMLSRGLMAKSALNTINNASLSAKNTGSTVVQPMFNDYTPAQLKAFADQIDNDPKLRAAGDVIVKGYRGLADYALEKGRISQQTYDNWVKVNPDYVHLSASFRESGDTGFLGLGRPVESQRMSMVDSSATRSLDEQGGIQAGAAADPMVELPKQIRATIRDVEQNAVRVETLEALKNGTEYGVKEVAGPGPKTISVYKNGVNTHYEVPDNALRYALEFSPTLANNSIAAVGRAVNSLFIQSTVGRVLNPLFSLVSASYEGVASAVSKPKGYHLGLINEALSKKGLSIGPLDPTGGLGSIPIGSIRYLWDSGIQQLANEAAQSLVDDNHLLARLLPSVADRQLLADRLMQSYAASIKGMATKEGVFSSNIYAQEDQLRPLQGIEGIMPDFSRYASERAAQEAAAGGTNFLERLYTASQNASVATNAQWWARAFSVVSNSMRESVKYQGYASNVAKIVDQDTADIIASQTRRLGGDMGQRGGNQAFNTFADWSTFVNTAIQPMAEIARRVKDDPLGLMMNIGAVTTGAVMAQYIAAATDPEVAEEIRNATDEQNASRIYFPGGLKIPMEQTFRPLWGPLVTVLNEISGLNDGQMDPNFVNVMKRWADSDFALSEETKFGMGAAFDAGVDSANPFSPANIPAASAIGATMGFDLGMSRYSDTPRLIKEPSEFGAEDRAMSATTEKAINALIGGTLSNYMKAAQDFAAAVGNDVDLGQAAKVALSRITDKAASGNGPVESLIFKGYDRVISANDADTQLYYKKKEGIATAQQVFRDELKYPGMSGANPKVDRLLPTEAVRPEYRNTMLFPIGAVTYKLNRELRDPIAELNMLRDIDKAVQDRTKQFSTTIEQRNQQRNALIDRRRELTELILFHMNTAEEQIQEITGDPSFTYNSMNINDYKAMPYPPAAPSQDTPLPE